MKKRPTLKPGYICRLSKKAAKRYGFGVIKKFTMIVESVLGDGSEGFTKVRCTFIYSHKSLSYKASKDRWSSCSFQRRDLWWTGYIYENGQITNANSGVKAAIKPVIHTGTHCKVCGKPLKITSNFMGTETWSVCNNPGCSFYMK